MIAKGLTPFFGAKVFAIMQKVPADAAANLRLSNHSALAHQRHHTHRRFSHISMIMKGFSVSLD
jgi:hypothetical protein